MEVCEKAFKDTFTNKYSTRGIFFLSGVRNIFISEETVKQMSELLKESENG